jgi:hypothetical protein
MGRSLTILLAAALAFAVPELHAQTRADGGTISIMREEGAPPAKHKVRKHKARKHRAARHGISRHVRGSSNPVYPAPLPPPQKPLAVPRYRAPALGRAKTPPPLFVPQTGRTLPNLPARGRGLGPGGKESFPQRAARCHQQAGIYGAHATGNPSAYINSCINQ